MCAQQIQEIPKLARNSLTSKSVKIVGTYPEKRCYEQTGNNKLARRGGGLTSAKTTILNGKSETTYHLHVSDDIRDICVIEIQIYIKPFLAFPWSKYVFLIACFFLIK